MKAVVLVLLLAPLCLSGLLAWREYRWRAKTADLVKRLKRAGSASTQARFAAAELEGLPAPVVR